MAVNSVLRTKEQVVKRWGLGGHCHMKHREDTSARLKENRGSFWFIHLYQQPAKCINLAPVPASILCTLEATFFPFVFL